MHNRSHEACLVGGNNLGFGPSFGLARTHTYPCLSWAPSRAPSQAPHSLSDYHNPHIAPRVQVTPPLHFATPTALTARHISLVPGLPFGACLTLPSPCASRYSHGSFSFVGHSLHSDPSSMAPVPCLTLPCMLVERCGKVWF